MNNTNLEGQITKDGASKALSNMKKKIIKVLGLKFLWKIQVIFIRRSIKYSFSTDELSVTQKEGIIAKGNNDKYLLKNWQPISL